MQKIPLAQRITKIKQEREKVSETKEISKDKDGNTASRVDSPAPRARRKPVRTYVDDDLDDIPLKSIKKEVKPEETVSMEKYYFGQIEGNNDNKKIAIAVECPVCNVEINNNCELMRHIYTHVVPPPAGATDTTFQCLYCLSRFGSDEDLQVHLKNNHPGDTKSPELFTYACLICEVRFAAVLTLASHMQKAHAPLELPYVCGAAACAYRGSSHRRAADHFHARHAHDDIVQCPHCFKVIPIYADGHELTSNIVLYLDHLKQHQDKEMEVTCNRCVLKFVHLGQMREHQIRDHDTVENATPLCSEEHLITKPRTKARPPVKDTTIHAIDETYEDMTLVLPDGMICRECDTPLDSDKHFLGKSSCSKCPFVTSCYRAMLRHSGYCAGPHSLEDAPRDAGAHLHCVCGYNTTVGTDMLTHLLMCEHKSAYSSAEEARRNTVRAPDETAPAAAAASAHAVAEPSGEVGGAVPEYLPPSVLNTQLSLDDLAPPSVLQPDQHDLEQLKEAYDRPLATPRHEEPQYTLGDFEPLPQEPPPQPDFEQL